MNQKILSHFQKVGQLSVKNPDYQRILDELFLFFVQNDHVQDDITVRMFLPSEVSSALKTGIVSAKTACVVSGIDEVMYLAKKHTKLMPKQFAEDGESVTVGTKIISFGGSAKDILAYERVFINILQRMSGIATETGEYVRKIKDLRLKNPPLIAATRKTPWMHVDKKAVAAGGGVTHRLDLSDGVLLKDNHLELLSQNLSLRGLASGPLRSEASEDAAISYAIEHANITDQNIAIEVEAKTEDAAFAAVKNYQKRKLQNPFIILLDNFTPDNAGKIVKEIKDNAPDIFFEASGGINLENIAEFSRTGVDVISIGALTHSPKAVDLSLDIY